MEICLNLAFKSCLFDRPPYKRESALLFWHLATNLKVSSNYIAASVNTDYNEAIIVLKSTERDKFQLHFLRLNDVTIYCGFFGIPLQQCTFWRQFSPVMFRIFGRLYHGIID